MDLLLSQERVVSEAPLHPSRWRFHPHLIRISSQFWLLLIGYVWLVVEDFTLLFLCGEVTTVLIISTSYVQDIV